MLIKAEGIVIKTMDYGEESKIVTIFTKDHGKISLMARGAKKTRSRISSVTQIFSYGEYIFYPGKQMGTLNQGDIQYRFIDILQDIDKTAYAAYLVELVDRLTEKSEPNSFLFTQLLSSLEHINAGKDMEIITRVFEMKMLLISGYRPHLHSCAICGNEEGLNAFSIRHGGLICNQHKEEMAITLQEGTVKLLRLFEGVDIKRLGNINVKESTKSQLQQVMNSFFDEYIGINFKSKNFLNQLKKFSE